MAITDLISKIILEDEFSKVFDKYVRSVNDADKSSKKLGSSFNGISLASGAVAGGVAAVASAAIEFGTQAAGAFVQAAEELINLQGELETSRVAFSQMFGGDQQAALALLSGLREQATRLGVSFSDASRFAKSILPDTKNIEQFNELLRLASIGAKDANLPLGELIFSFNELASGDLTSIRDRLDIPKETVNKIKAAGAATGDYLTPAIEELNALFAKRGINDIVAFGDTYQTAVGQMTGLTDELKIQFSEPIFDAWKEILQETVGILGDNKEELLALAKAGGDTFALLLMSARDMLKALYPTVEFVDKLLDSMMGFDSTPLEKIVLVMETLNRIIAIGGASSIVLATFFSEVLPQAVEASQGRIGAFFNALNAGLDAIGRGEDPFAAFDAAIDSAKVKTVDWQGALKTAREAGVATFLDMASVINKTRDEGNAFNLTLAENAKQWQKLSNMVNGDAEAMADAVAGFADKAGDVNEKYLRKATDLEYEHAQRVKELNQELAQAVAESAAEAAAARTKSAEKMAADIAAIEQDLAADKAKAQNKANEDLDKLTQDRRKAERDAARDIAEINRNLAQELNDLQTKTAQSIADNQRDAAQDITDTQRDAAEEIAEVNQKLANDLAESEAGKQADIARIVSDSADKLLALEKSTADKRKQINDEFESEFAEADPFKRKIMEFNRQEQLAQLEQQTADEKAAIETQKSQAIIELEAKVAAEQAILIRDAAQRKAIIDREAAEKTEAIAREAAERTAALEAEAAERTAALQREAAERRAATALRLADQKAEYEQRKAEIARELAEEQAQKDAAAAQAIAKLQASQAEELARIDEQQAAKVASAQAALTKEEQNYQNRLAAQRRAQALELGELSAQLQEAEELRRASYARQLFEAMQFQSNLMNIQGGGGGTTNNYTTNNSVAVNNYGQPGGYTGATNTAYTVINAMNGF